MENGEIMYEIVHASPRPPPKISLKHDWMKELGSEVARQAEGSQPTQPNPNSNHDRTGRPVVCSQNTSRSRTQEIEARFSRDCRNSNLDVEANHEWTVRPVVCRNKMKILVFVSSSRRSRTTHIDNLFNSIYNKTKPTTHLLKSPRRWLRTLSMCKDNTSKDPFSQCENLQNLQGIHTQVKSEYVGTLTRSEVMTKMQSDKHDNMFNVAANVKHVETYENINWRLVSAVDWTTAELVRLQCLGISWKKVKPNEAPFNVRWTFSQSRTMSLRRDDLMAIDMGNPQNKDIIMLPIIFERDASRGILKGSTIAFWMILNFVHLNSNMIELKRSVSRWTSFRKKISPMMWRTQNTFDTERIGGSLNNSGRSGPLRDRSDFNDALTTLNRRHQESGERQLRPVPLWKYQYWHPSSSSSSSWCQCMSHHALKILRFS